MKPRNECLYYLVREMDNLGVKAKDIYFEDILRHVRQDGFNDMRRLEIRAVFFAAGCRGRLEELNKAVEEYMGGVI